MNASDGMKEAFVASYKAGKLLSEIHRLALDKFEDHDEISDILTSLHNGGLIDLVSEFSKLNNGPSSQGDFWSLRHIFEGALPHINSPAHSVVACVSYLFMEAKEDLAAGTILEPYIRYCETNPSRPREALTVIEGNQDFLNLLTATLVAASRIDTPDYIAEILRLVVDRDIEVRRRAVYALGRVECRKDASGQGALFAGLERAVCDETDDQLLGAAVKSAFEFLSRDTSLEERSTQLVEKALQKGDEYVLHAGAELFESDPKGLPCRLREALASHMCRVNPANKGTLRKIDSGIARLVKSGDFENGVSILENVLNAHPEELSLVNFEAVVRRIGDNQLVLNKVATRWFLLGDRVLCEGVARIVERPQKKELPIEIDLDELGCPDESRVLFLARKAIGYLFFYPISAASMVISLMHLAPSDAARLELGQHLYEHLLLNFSGKGREYVVERTEHETGAVKELLAEALQALDDYMEELHSVGEIPELYPSETQRVTYHRKMHRQMTESFKEAEKRSPLLSLMSKQVLLYGRGTISYVFGPEGEPRRVEIPLRSHGVEFEIPRGERLDPFGLDYVLRLMRAEQLRR